MLVERDTHDVPSYVIEPAKREDDPDLRALFRRTSMGSGIEVTFEREPSFFDAVAIQGDQYEIGTIRENRSGTLVGCGTRSMRNGFINGQETKVGYLGDLRIDKEHRNGTLTARLYRSLKNRGIWCDWYYTVIFEENTTALNALTTGRGRLPLYHDCGRIHCPSIELRGKLPPLTLPGVFVRRAFQDDLHQIVDFLNQNLIRRQFSTCYQVEDFLEHGRLEGLKATDFYIAEKNGKLIGVVAAWDQSAFKQTRIVKYNGYWRLIAPTSRVLASFRGTPGLPFSGEYLSYFYATCLTVENDDVDVFRILLRELYNSKVGMKWLYFMIGLHERDPLLAALDEYPKIPFAGRLFAVSLSDNSKNAPLDDRIPSIEVSML